MAAYDGAAFSILGHLVGPPLPDIITIDCNVIQKQPPIFLFSHNLFVTEHFCAALLTRDSPLCTLLWFLDTTRFKLTLLSMRKFHMTLVAPRLIL